MQLKELMEDNKKRYDIVETLSKLTFKYAEKIIDFYIFVIDITFKNDL